MKKILNNKKIIIVIGILLGVIGIIIILFSALNKQNKSDFNDNSCSIIANNVNDFKKYVNADNKSCDSYEVKYNNLKYELKQNNDTLIYPKIYYMDNEIYNFDESIPDYSGIYLSNLYLLNDIDTKSNEYLFIFHEVPVAQNPKYYILAVNDNGNVLFSDEFNASSEVKYDDTTKELSYSFVNFKYNLMSAHTTDKEFCNLIKEYSDNGFINNFIDENGVYQGSNKYKYENGSMVLVESNITTITDLKNQFNCNYESVENIKKYEISLNNSQENHNFDELDLNFSGVKTNNDYDYYNYVLDIYYNNQKIDSPFFNDTTNYRIWSENMASTFKIYKIENVYFIVSTIAKQCFGTEVLIFNTTGEVLKTFSNCDFTIENNNVEIVVSDNGQCLGDWEKHTTKYNYYISDTKIISK